MLDRLTTELGLDDISSAIRFLVREKCRALGITDPTAPPKGGPKKKRRAGT